jgi:hypothetical protein
MTGPALGRTDLGPIDACLGVATGTRRCGVGRDTVKAKLDVARCRPPRLPILLAMATQAIRPERGGVRVAVAPGAAAGGIGGYRPLVIVTTKTCGLRVSTFQAMPGFFGMVEGEVLPQSAPISPRMANAAVTGKRPVRRDVTPRRIPAGLPCVQAATENGHHGRSDEQRRGRRSLFANTPHGSPGITQAQFHQRRIHVIPLKIGSPAEHAPLTGKASVET